ncbi:MAG TPA: UDP-N-acetylmuramate dehydrogenase [Candidatus Paceibacterota bacterium]
MIIDENIPLKHLTTFKIGGLARYFCLAKSLDDLKEAVLFSKKQKLPIFVLGGGSNVLISDYGFGGLVIKIAISGVTFEDDKTHSKIRVGAGEGWDDFVSEAVNKGLWGIENLSGIPGTVGGAPVQNIGAYGVDVSSVIDSVEIFDADIVKFRTISGEQCRFGYRDSLFKHENGKNYIIVAVNFKLLKLGKPNIQYKDLAKYFGAPNASKPDLKSVRQAVLKIRSEKFPPLSKYGTAGSFFKNPVVSENVFADVRKSFPEIPVFATNNGNVKVPLAWILDKACNFKGRKINHVALYEKQPLVLVNLGEATAHEVSVFADKVAADVKRRTGIEIEREVQVIGEENTPDKYKTFYWRFIYRFMKIVTAVVQSTGWHNFRQPYLIGHLRAGRTAESLLQHLYSRGYSKAYMAWKDPGEIFSVRKIVREKFQYHVRLFRDGELKGHYEYTAEAKPLDHLNEKIFLNTNDYFENLLHEFLEPF